MAYSYTEKKRIRKDFGKRPTILDVPYLLATQIDSYREFLQDESPDGAARTRSDCTPRSSRVPDRELFRQCSARIRELPARRARIRRQGVPDPRVRPTRRRCGCSVRLVIYDKESGAQQGHQGHQGAGSLHGRDPAHDRERHLRHQRHRARHRLAAAPLARRLLRPRQGQDAFLGQAAVFGPRDSVPRFLAGLRVRSQGLRLRAHRPPPQAPGDGAAARPRLHRRGNAGACSSTPTPSTLPKDSISLDLVPERLRGETRRASTSTIGEGSWSWKGRRITARHIRRAGKGRASSSWRCPPNM